MIRAACFALALLASAAHAQDRTPAQLMGSLILLMVVSDECRLPITPEERQRITVAGQRLQQQLRMNDPLPDGWVLTASVTALAPYGTVAARELGTDNGEALDAAFGKIVPPKLPGQGRDPS